MKSVRHTLRFRLGKITILPVTQRHPPSSLPVKMGSPEGGRETPISTDCVLVLNIRVVVIGGDFMLSEFEYGSEFVRY